MHQKNWWSNSRRDDLLRRKVNTFQDVENVHIFIHGPRKSVLVGKVLGSLEYFLALLAWGF